MRRLVAVVTGKDGRADENLACAQYIARRAAGVETDAARASAAPEIRAPPPR